MSRDTAQGVSEGAASDVKLQVRRHKKSSSSRRSGCRGDAQDAQSSLQELDLNPTEQSAGQGWSSSYVKMSGEEA